MLFIQHPSRLYYHDLAKKDQEWSMLNSEWENKFSYSSEQFKLATQAKDAMSMVRRSSDKDYILSMTSNQIDNLPVKSGIHIARKCLVLSFKL